MAGRACACINIIHSIQFHFFPTSPCLSLSQPRPEQTSVSNGAVSTGERMCVSVQNKRGAELGNLSGRCSFPSFFRFSFSVITLSLHFLSLSSLCRLHRAVPVQCHRRPITHPPYLPAIPSIHDLAMSRFISRLVVLWHRGRVSQNYLPTYQTFQISLLFSYSFLFFAPSLTWQAR